MTISWGLYRTLVCHIYQNDLRHCQKKLSLKLELWKQSWRFQWIFEIKVLPNYFICVPWMVIVGTPSLLNRTHIKHTTYFEVIKIKSYPLSSSSHISVLSKEYLFLLLKKWTRNLQDIFHLNHFICLSKLVIWKTNLITHEKHCLPIFFISTFQVRLL